MQADLRRLHRRQGSGRNGPVRRRPGVPGQAFVAAAKEVDAHRHLVIMTSGAASSVYPGWASSSAGKAAVGQSVL